MRKDASKVIPALQAEAEAFYRNLNNSRKVDEEFSVLPKGMEDEPLTEDEIAQIDAFWGKYKFAYPEIDYKSFRTFKNRSGIFSPYHCPGSIRTSHFGKHFVDLNYTVPFQNKAMFDFMYPELHRPKTVARRMNGLYYDAQYNHITLDEAVELCCNYVQENGDVLVKPSGLASSGGHGIVFLTKKNATPAFVRKVFTVNMGIGVFVVQEKLEQSKFMSELNDSSVNTIRITSLLHKGKVHPLGALIRVGKAGNGVDAYYSGGAILGIDMETGKCHPWALASDHTRITVLPSGKDLAAEELIVPNFDKVKEDIVRAHYRNPYIKMISWDIALDKNDMPTFIECNFGGMLQLHEAVNGPLFGDLMPELCDEYLLKRFFIKFATEDYICKEFHDHIAIVEYIGSSGEVKIPDKLRDKPVTKIEQKAFKGCEITNFSAPLRLMKQAGIALADHIKNG